MRLIHFLFLSTIVLSSSSCGDSEPQTAAAPWIGDQATIRIEIPKGLGEIKVKKGTTVSFNNLDQKDQSITSIFGVWDSGRIRPGKVFVRTFDQEGDFDFVSVFDRTVKGVVRVSGN